MEQMRKFLYQIRFGQFLGMAVAICVNSALRDFFWGKNNYRLQNVMTRLYNSSSVNLASMSRLSGSAK